MDRGAKQITNSSYGSDGQQAAQATTSVPDEAVVTTVITKNITISGNLRGEGDVLVEGTAIGGIDVDGTVTIVESGTVQGSINADAVYVSGCVRGNITAKTCLHLKMAGSITGDVTIRSFTIEDGGYFNGQCHMTNPGEEPVILY